MLVRVSQFFALWAFVSPSLAVCQAQNQAQQPVMQTRDGGASGRMESIFVPAMAGVPLA